MTIQGISYESLQHALDAANGYFSDNIVFKRCERVARSRAGGETFRVTLTVKSSRAAGSRRSPPNGWDKGKQRRISAACWHAHKAFLDALPPGAVVVGGRETTISWSPGDAHADWNVGSQMYPCMLSDACECTSNFAPFVDQPQSQREAVPA